MGGSWGASLLSGHFNRFEGFVFGLELLALKLGREAESHPAKGFEAGLVAELLIEVRAGGQREGEKEKKCVFHRSMSGTGNVSQESVEVEPILFAIIRAFL